MRPDTGVRHHHQNPRDHAAAAGRPWDVEATMRGVADLIAYGDDRANGCTGLTDSAVWKAHRRRILDVELAEVAADRPGDAPPVA